MARSRLLTAVGVVGAIGLSVAAAPATASTPDDGEPTSDDVLPDEAPADGDGPASLDPGPWILAGQAIGRVDTTTGDVQIDFLGTFPVTAKVDVSSSGDVNGDWRLDGDATLDLIAGGGVTSTAAVGVTGDGLAGGDGRQMDLVGGVSINGSATAVVAGREQTVPINYDFTGMMQWRILGEVCNRAWGEWVFSGDLNVSNAGFTIEAEGYWTGQRDTDALFADSVAAFEAIWGDGQAADSDLRLFRESTQLISEFNSWVDAYPNWSVGQMIALAERAETLIASFNALTDCQRSLFSPALIEEYVNGLTHVVQHLLITFRQLSDGNPPTDAWVHLTHLGARVGAFGAGAPNPAQAVAAEEAMRRAGQDILDASSDDGFPNVTDDTTRVVATAAAMGWQLDIGSGLEPAADIWARHFGTPPPDTTGEGDGS